MKKLIFVLAFALAGCSSISVPETPAQKVFAATQMYDVALTVAVAYKELPSCDLPTAPKICSDAGVVETVKKADTVAYESLTAAQAIVRAPAPTQSALQTAVMWAQGAITAFAKITNSLVTR